MTKGKEPQNGVKIASSTNGVGRSGQLHKTNETQLPIYIIHKNKFKVDKRLKYKSWHHKSHTGEYRQENLRHSMQQYCHWYVP